MYDLGIPADEIGKLNLKEYDALIRRKTISDNHARLNTGIIAAAVLNSAMGDPDREPVDPLDFVPNWKPKQVDLTELTPEQQKDYFMNMFFKQKQGARR